MRHPDQQLVDRREHSWVPSSTKATGSIIQLAVGLGEHLRESARALDDTSITWGRGIDRYKRPIADAGIYNGRCGEALFLAALYAATGQRQWQELSLRALGSLRSRIDVPEYWTELASLIGHGLAGVGSIMYCLVTVGRFLEYPTLQAEGRRIACALDQKAGDTNRACSVMWGTAGAILGLLAVADDGDQWALQLAIERGHALVTARIPDEVSGLRAWHGDVPSGTSPRPVCGFAHGTSGIAHALFELYKRSGEACFYDAALEAWASERQMLRGKHGADGSEKINALAASWCNGATGIGLSRLAALRHVRSRDRVAIESDFRASIELACTIVVRNAEILCCGRPGQIDFLLECGRRTGESVFTEVALRMAQPVIATLKTRAIRPPPGTTRPDGGGLWQGVAGLGYTLLRLADPAALPCILLLSSR